MKVKAVQHAERRATVLVRRGVMIGGTFFEERRANANYAAAPALFKLIVPSR
jgi:hypothetical protein